MIEEELPEWKRLRMAFLEKLKKEAGVFVTHAGMEMQILSNAGLTMHRCKLVDTGEVLTLNNKTIFYLMDYESSISSNRKAGAAQNGSSTFTGSKARTNTNRLKS